MVEAVTDRPAPQVAGAPLGNAKALSLEDVAAVDARRLRDDVAARCRAGGRLAALFALPCEEEAARGHEVIAVVARDAAGGLEVMRTRLAPGDALPSLTPELPEAQAFERELHESWGIPIDGHPWLKPLRAHPALPGRRDPRPPHPFFEVAGEGVHEVAVGPVHAGIIEPGHFRFQCHGETVLSLEIHLGYQHRGVEALLRKRAPAGGLAVAESIAGDTAVGHATAYCMTVEGLANAAVPPRAAALRALALELERLACHIGDLGGLATDVAYLPGAAALGRLRGGFLNLLMELSGNRFGRGLLAPGGVRHALDDSMRASFAERLDRFEAELDAIAGLMFETPSVLSRFEGTGVVTEAAASELGLVGPVARASGVARDVRTDHPTVAYAASSVPIVVESSGDVMARALVRLREARHALAFVRARLRELPDGPLSAACKAPAASSVVVALVEGWRGEIAHIAVTGASGELRGYKVVDPSFRNWFGLAMALRSAQISDFPLCNKSFNLSYAGHDL